MGYGHEDFGYRLWDPVSKKIVRSRDVIFLEDQTIEDLEKTDKPITVRHSANYEPGPSTRSPVDGRDVQVDNDGDDLHDEPTPQPDLPDVEVPPEPPVEPELRRSTRERHPSQKYSSHEYVMNTETGEPKSYQEAMSDEHKKDWLKAMQEEMKSLHENHTFELVKLPKGKGAFKNKWVFKLKADENISRPRYKARLVMKGFEQKKGIDFEEIFSPVVKMSSIRVVLGLAASLNLEVEQLDVKTAFLHGDIDKEIYMEQPEGFEVKGKEHLVCKLKKSLYGLKQAPREWYTKFDSFMEGHGYSKTSFDHCVYVKKFSDGDFIILLLYIDDMLIVGHDTKKIESLKKDLNRSFAMKDLGPTKKILGMRITRDRKNGKLWLSQQKYIEKVLERFSMSNSKPVSTLLASHFKQSSQQCTSEKEKAEMKKIPYASAVGSLMYAMVCTRQDIAHAVGVVSRFFSNPGKEHWQAVKWILRYFNGTSRVLFMLWEWPTCVGWLHRYGYC
ncbi:Retrovirus-related Pol polyprotein [Arachis hypogaea]|nr:Retrovirus-related Pol polyprotein [Arachis hypogaea]